MLSHSPHDLPSSATNSLEEMEEMVIDEVDANLFMTKMLPVEDLYFPKAHPTAKTAMDAFKRWEVYYSSYVKKCSGHGQVVPINQDHKWRFLRFDKYNEFKTLDIDDLVEIVSLFISKEMIGLFPLAYEALDPEMLSYVFYRFYAPFIIFVDGKASIVPNLINERFIPRSDAEEKVTRKISLLIRQFEDLSSMENPISSDECKEDNDELGGVYQRLEPRSARVTLGEGLKLVMNILQDFPFIKEVVFADLGSGMNLFPLYASAMYGWKSVGIEVVKNRVQLAAIAQGWLFEHECKWFSKLRVGMFQKNLATTTDNWGGITFFLMWDKVNKNKPRRGSVILSFSGANLFYLFLILTLSFYVIRCLSMRLWK